ncbi:hypothetical protein [Calothrix sp. PCC 7507]|uniref:hypothetical protein n=1 Tax=Calothrix sp. PCC 7507 TaxID=99598 RepID=UPI00029F35ED|nr:hypothetical protein [Calothrix sp. PCC 7507]AFY31374.1 hypothetical protein Cal7507_0893 [Calothrix sp. PCC 7507]
MNSDSESLQHQLLSWVLADNAETHKHLSVECEEVDGVENPLKEATAANSGEPELGGTPQTFQLGEIPTVQERFQAVLKRRLQIQIQSHPPLFPWETQLTDYPDYVDEPSLALVPSWGWMAQQSKLNLPITLPERVFQQLLEKCQELLTSSLPLGAKLVQVVEDFFPNDTQTLNDLAGLVLRSTYRSSVDTLTTPNIQSDYSELLERQQMALSLLAAKQLLENLTLPLSLTKPVVEREWLTSLGTLTLKVEYQSQNQLRKLCVQGELPAKGTVKLYGNNTQVMAQSLSAGSVSVEIYCGRSNETYTLEVEFPEMEQQPLLFVISTTM